MLTGQPALMWTNIVLTVLNIFGIGAGWAGRRRWRRARAPRRSERAHAGRDAFPVSLLAGHRYLRREGTRSLHRRDGRLPKRAAELCRRFGRRACRRGRDSTPASVGACARRRRNVVYRSEAEQFEQLEELQAGPMAGALIVTAELRRGFCLARGTSPRHYPPERNQLPAHLTMFHALPPSAEAEVRPRLAQAAQNLRRRRRSKV